MLSVEQAATDLRVADGDFEQFGSQPDQSLLNSGKSLIELIDLELK